MEEKLITYTLERDGKVFVVEHVPARVSKETGEAFFSPETVDRLQAIIAGKSAPVRRIEAPVYEFAAQPALSAHQSLSPARATGAS